MDNENEINKASPVELLPRENNLSLIGNVVIVVALIVGAYVYTARLSKIQESGILWPPARLNSRKGIFLQDNVRLPVEWGNIGVKMIEAGIIDKEKFENLYEGRGRLTEADKKLLESSDNGNLVITSENSGIILNLLWALGLGNENAILENGPMMDPKYGGAGNFASTGGWTLAQGNAMDHFSMHKFVTLTPEQQALVEQVAKNIYRPCCGNSTYFPDCNHGMAMLGLLELMASQGIDEANMYRAALKVNAYWFPDTYLTIAKYFEQQGVAWDAVDPKEALGENFSSSAGYRRVVSELARPTETITPSRRPSGGCGV